MLRRLVALLLASVAFAPLAGAFSSTQGDVVISYEQAAAPLVLAAGALDLQGFASGGILAADVAESRTGIIPVLSVVDSRPNATLAAQSIERATLVIHDGNLAWNMANGSATIEATAGYGLALALSSSPLTAPPGSGQEGNAPPGLILASPAISSTLAWARGEVQILPFDATISILDSSGKPVAGYDRVRVNANADLQAEDARGSLVLSATGAFDVTLASRALAVGLDNASADARLRIRVASEDRFVDSITAVQDAMSAFAGANVPTTPAAAFSQMEPLGGFFNGAAMILNVPGENESAPIAAIEAKLNDKTLDADPFTLVRSPDLALAWSDGKITLAGRGNLAVTKQGFETAPPLVAGPVPILALLLWLAAIGAIVVFFVKRPPKPENKKAFMKQRLIGLGVYAGVLLLVFVWWDYSFAQTFGTSLLRFLAKNGFSARTLPQLGTIFGIEMLPWTFAALLFALPVRIGLGVLLRYRGQGSAHKSLAKVGGLLSLAIFGPLYALWIVNALIAQILKFAPNLFPAGG